MICVKKTALFKSLALKFLASAVLLSAIISCSSAPKRAMRVTDTGEKADLLFEQGNSYLAGGKINEAGKCFSESYRLAVSIDDADLLCRICLSAVIYKIQSAPEAPYFSEHTKYSLLDQARGFSDRSGNKKFYDNVCDIYQARILISDNTSDGEKARAALNMLSEKEKELSKDSYYMGYLCRTKGDALTALGSFSQAAALYADAAGHHLKDRYLLELGVDWYSCARAKSLAGDRTGAVAAIENALKYDKDAENTAAIASDYRAYAKILTKGEYTEAEKNSAVRALKWAGAVYKSGGFDKESDDCILEAEKLSSK